jgi:hypothetical protein
MGKKKERKIRVKFSWGEKATKRERAKFHVHEYSKLLNISYFALT